MLIPYEVDVPYDRQPVMNWLVVSAIIVVFILIWKWQHDSEKRLQREFASGQRIEDVRDIDPTTPYVLYGWTFEGFLGHMWIHYDILHVLGNLIFLWLFGNAICSKIGGSLYLPIYLLLGMTAAAFHEVFNGAPAIGASGAINGIIGMYLVFFPENEVSCVWILSLFPFLLRPFCKTFSISGFYVILLWFVYDVWGLIKGKGYVAHWAHFGGFVSGFVLAVLLLKLKYVVMEDRYEKSLLQMIWPPKVPVDGDVRRELAHWQREFIASQPPQPEAPAAAGATATIPFPDEEDSVNPAEASEVSFADAEPPQTDIFTDSAAVSARPLDNLENRFIWVRCSCGEKIQVPLALSAGKITCPSCKKNSQMSDEKFIYITCRCNEIFKVPAVLAGRYGRCPRCNKRIQII
jgi:membrane associated rhomboid family serine protease